MVTQDRDVAPIDRLLQRVGAIVLAVGVASVLLVSLHHLAALAARAPHVAVDDGLANIAVSLSREGRYGFPASPVQGGTGALRTDGFFNYGPAPFVIGAGLDWLFGTSYRVQRLLHPVGLAFIALGALLAFRRTSLAAGALVALALFELQWHVHWPMFRPDIGVAMFAMLAVAFFATAVRNDRPAAWFAGGFCTATAVTTHMISWILVPWSIVVWGASRLQRPREIGEVGTTRPGWRRHVPSLVALGVGGCAGVGVFLTFIDFRVADVLAFWTASLGLEGAEPRSYTEVLGRHFDITWSYAPSKVRRMALFGFIAATVALAFVLWKRRDVPRAALALLLPAVTVALFYQLGLGVYDNYHAGYGILSQVSTLWTAAAAVAVALALVRNQWDGFGRRAEIAAQVIVGALLVSRALKTFEKPPLWAGPAAHNVDFDTYRHEILSVVPPGAATLGSLTLGLESGGNDNLIQLSDGMLLASKVPMDERRDLAPDFLVLRETTRDGTFTIVRAAAGGGARGDVLGNVHRVFPDARYELAALVSAPPYGTTRIHRRAEEPARAAPLPLVAVNRGGSRQWARRIGPPVDVAFQPTEPLRLRLIYWGTTEGAATRTVTASVEAGTWLVSARVMDGSPDTSGLLVATDAAETTATASDTGFPFVSALYYREPVVHCVVIHPGGPLFLGIFDANPEANLRVEAIRAVSYVTGGAPQTLDIPPLAQWTLGAGVTAEPHGADGLAVVGDASAHGAQIASPDIDVRPGSTLSLHVPLAVEHGAVAWGLIDEDGQWLVTPQPSVNQIEFEVGATRTMTIRVVNFAHAESDGPVRFAIGPGRLTVVRPGLPYVDRLIEAGGAQAVRRPGDESPD